MNWYICYLLTRKCDLVQGRFMKRKLHSDELAQISSYYDQVNIVLVFVYPQLNPRLRTLRKSWKQSDMFYYNIGAS